MKTIEEKFWDRVVKADGCWSWLGSKHRDGYGKFSPAAGTYLTAHRVSWAIHFGPIPMGLFVCHHCDNPECTNPEHLFLGTPQDNMDDKVRKGRWVGSAPRRPPRVVKPMPRRMGALEAHIPDIVARRNAGESLSAIAGTFACDKMVIKRLLVQKGLYVPSKPGPRSPHNARTAEVREHLPEILERRNNGETIDALAALFGVGPQTMSKIIRTASIAGHAEDICSPLAA